MPKLTNNSRRKTHSKGVSLSCKESARKRARARRVIFLGLVTIGIVIFRAFQEECTETVSFRLAKDVECSGQWVFVE